MQTLAPAQAGPTQPAPQRQQDDARLREAAEQFEALLIAEMLKSMRGENSWSGWGEAGGEAATPVMELGEECLAQAMARQGGLGLAAMVIKGLEQAGGGAGS